MAEVKFVPGEMLSFKSKKSFGLNFEDKTPSVKILEGDTVFYDGEVASYQTRNGAEVQGRTPWLRGAIRMDWLILVPGRPKTIRTTADTKISGQAKMEQSIKTRQRLYDGLRGGSFDEYVKTGNMNVEKEEDRIVKNIEQPVEEEAPKSEKLEIAGDQVEVKSQDESGSFIVTSSTAQPRTKTHTKKIRSAEDYGADSTKPMKSAQQKEDKTPKKRNAYTIDATTPFISEGATKEEIKRAKGIIDAEESQNATVVRKIKRGSMRVEETDGIKITSQVGNGDKPISTKAMVGSSERREIDIKARVGKGSEKVTDITSSQEAIVVTKQVSKTASKTDATQDFLDKMPDDWGDMHWTKKEKFIRQQTDKGLLEFIMRVETIKVVKAACKARLDELK